MSTTTMNGSKAGVILDPIRPQFAPVNAPSIQASWALHYSLSTSHPPPSFLALEYINLQTYSYPLVQLFFLGSCENLIVDKNGWQGNWQVLKFLQPCNPIFCRENSRSSCLRMYLSTQSASQQTYLSPISTFGRASFRVQEQVSLCRAQRTLLGRMKESTLNIASSSATQGIENLSLLRSSSMEWISVVDHPLGEYQNL